MEPKEYLKPVEKVRRVPNIYHSPTFGVPMWAGRPQPPLTRFARDVRAFLRGKGTGGTGRVEEAYPVGVARARETEHVTVDAIRRVGTGAIGEEDGCWQALVRFQPRKTSERDDQSVFQSLGLEVGQELRGGTVVSSVVSVVEGGLLSQWSVAPGMEVIDDGGKGHVTIAMETPFRPVGDFSDDDEERENIPPPPPAYVGGMALTTHQDSIAKMLLSMYFTANEALLEDACSHKTDAELSPPCGKAERTALAARKKAFLDSLPGKLGLDVIGGEEGQGRSGLVQVISVAPESLADFYGVRVEDTIVGINGYPLIRLSRAGFLDKVAKALTTCASGAPSGGVLRLFLVRKGKSPPLLTKAQISKSRASPSPSPPWEGNEVPAAAARPPRVKRARRPQTRPGGKDRKQHYKRWDEASPMDAVPQISVEAAAAAAAAAAQGRAERKELRKRPLWWDKRAKGSTLCVLRLRPAKAADRLDPARRVQEDQGSRGHVPGKELDAAFSCSVMLDFRPVGSELHTSKERKMFIPRPRLDTRCHPPRNRL
ncbi:unnamed protein product [Ectocarpus sp. 12 AP-2014]